MGIAAVAVAAADAAAAKPTGLLPGAVCVVHSCRPTQVLVARVATAAMAAAGDGVVAPLRWHGQPRSCFLCTPRAAQPTGRRPAVLRRLHVIGSRTPAATRGTTPSLPVALWTEREGVGDGRGRGPNGAPRGRHRGWCFGRRGGGGAEDSAATGEPAAGEMGAVPGQTAGCAAATAAAPARRRPWPPAPAPVVPCHPVHRLGGHPPRASRAPPLQSPRPGRAPPASAACMPARADRTAVSTPHGISPAAVRG